MFDMDDKGQLLSVILELRPVCKLFITNLWRNKEPAPKMEINYVTSTLFSSADIYSQPFFLFDKGRNALIYILAQVPYLEDQ